MFYIIRDNGIQNIDQAEWENSTEGIGIFESEEWTEQLELKEKFSLTQGEKHIFFCKLESHASYLFGTFHIPVKKKEKRNSSFAVYILEGKLIFIDDGTFVEEVIEKLKGRTQKKNYSSERFLCDFFMALMEEDILYLAALEREIAEMEEKVLEGNTEHFNFRMLGMKKEISRLYCYYSQMADVGEVLCEHFKICRIFSERSKRLQQEVQSLREYAMQVQDVYQSEIGIHQNNIMKVLTVVTTIFLPLTLIAGWYGMNFYYMPELAWEYGYPTVAGISVLIVIISLWFFKKKKFF